MARPRKSDAEHRRDGTKPHPSTAKSQSDIPAARPKMPSHLSPEARKAWRGLVKSLEERGTLTGAGSMTRAIWADTPAGWILANDDVHQCGIVTESSALDAISGAVASRLPN